MKTGVSLTTSTVWAQQEESENILMIYEINNSLKILKEKARILNLYVNKYFPNGKNTQKQVNAIKTAFTCTISDIKTSLISKQKNQ